VAEEKKIKSLMIIDDSDADVYLTRKFLEMTGRFEHVFNASNGEEALEYFKKLRKSGGQKPDVILLDINMPRMNGFEVLEEYEKLLEENGNATDCFILMFTTSDYADDIERAGRYESVSRYLTKPLTPANAMFITDEFGS
jgi:CheY-like chemotaxis protein